jgi:predicted metalloprotease with PDZ domain
MLRLALALAAVLSGPVCAASSGQMDVHVDLREAPKVIAHARLRIAAHPGPLVLLYPKWIPGTHWPSGPIGNLTGLHFSAGGREFPWRRDAYDVYRFLLDVPVGADHVDVTLDYLGVGLGAAHGGNAADLGNDRITVLPWHVALLYPEGIAAARLRVNASLTLPAGWEYATALPGGARSGDEVQFAPTDLDTLVDSPVLVSRQITTVSVEPTKNSLLPPHSLQIAADSPADAHVSCETLGALSRLPAQAQALFGSFPFKQYQFLTALSDHYHAGGISGLEHVSSSDIRGPLESFTQPRFAYNVGLVFPHEYVHAWNGKLHRPSGEDVEDFNTPIRTDEVWISEGLTMYWGEVLAVRSGLWSAQTFTEQLAYRVALLDHEAGRSWRSLQDASTGQEALMTTKSRGDSWRRGEDYYAEGALLWLEADLRIRELSHNSRSLDDFARELFHGLKQGEPARAMPYSAEDVYAELERVVPGDWRNFFLNRVNETGRSPLPSLAGSGWRLLYGDEPTQVVRDVDSAQHQRDAWFSLGIIVQAGGAITDVLWSSPADHAGLTGGLSIRQVNGQPFSLEAFDAALRLTASARAEVSLRVEDAGQQRDVTIRYAGGPRYPKLGRQDGSKDRLADLLRAR